MRSGVVVWNMLTLERSLDGEAYGMLSGASDALVD
jgi:hypothetical protein